MTRLRQRQAIWRRPSTLLKEEKTLFFLSFFFWFHFKDNGCLLFWGFKFRNNRCLLFWSFYFRNYAFRTLKLLWFILALLLSCLMIQLVFWVFTIFCDFNSLLESLPRQWFLTHHLEFLPSAVILTPLVSFYHFYDFSSWFRLILQVFTTFTILACDLNLSCKFLPHLWF